MSQTTDTYASPDRVVQVKSGFNWAAFLLGAMWAAAKGMWWPYFFLLLLAEVGIWAVAAAAEASGNAALAFFMLAVMVGFPVYRGFKGNAWLAQSLLRRGFVKR